MGLSQGINGQQAQPGVCTSISRPPSPFLGQVIFETDTNLLKVYETDGWSVGTQLSPWNISPQPGAPTPTSGSTQVSLTWSAPSSPEPITDYKVYFSTSAGGSYTLFADGVSNATSATVTGLTNGTQYFFKISAVNAAGESLLSNASAGSTPAPPSPTVEYLIVGGGGGGGVWAGGGGGGAGGLLSGTFATVLGTTYTINVGPGGTSGGSGVTPLAGTLSSAFGFTANGGGRGGGDSGVPTTGGSGGGGGRSNQSGVAGTAGQGNSGGNSVGQNAGGGGGAGGNGATTASNIGGAGGVGVQSSITGLATFYAGGGGGGAHESGGTGGTGGSGGGGNANSACNNASPGSPNTGGGGGGASGITLNCGQNGGAGGSGVVIIAYPSTFPAPTSTTGSPTVSTVSRAGYRVYTFTGTGSITF